MKSVHFKVLFTLTLLVFTAWVRSYGQCNEKCYIEKPYINDPKQLAKFAAEKKWESSDTINNVMYVNVLDVLNNDGIPELIIGSKRLSESPPWSTYINSISIFNSVTHQLEKKINTHYVLLGAAAPFIFVDIDNDCNYEIIVAASHTDFNPENIRGRLVCYSMDGDIRWISNERYGINLLGSRMEVALLLADFNRDGNVEVVVGNEIFNVHSGVKLCGGGNNGSGTSFAGARPVGHVVAANLDNDDDLELAAGYTVYKVKITNTNGLSGNTMTPINMIINNNKMDGSTAVADIDGDGKLDIIVSPHLEIYDTNTKNYIALYCYTIENNTAKLIATAGHAGWRNGGSILVGQTSKNGPMSILIANERKDIRSYSYNGTNRFNLDWTYPIQENSQLTGLSMFDFNNDGNMEIMYRDFNRLMILNIKNKIPELVYEMPCVSETYYERPIVADIDNSGQAKLCITCALNNDSKNSFIGRIYVLGAPEGQYWAPARKIWNQFSYNPLFINDDGTVPENMHNPATYKNGKYNNFMVQESLIDEDGNYPAPAASVYGEITCVNYDVVTDSYTVEFKISNRHDASSYAASGLPISFYNGHPEKGGSLVGTTTTPINYEPGEQSDLLTFQFSSIDFDQLWMIINTDNYPIELENSSYYKIDECDYTDNVFIFQMPEIEHKINDICDGETIEFDGQTITDPGKYFKKTQNSSGCDSLIEVLEIIVADTKNTIITQSGCDEFSWNGQIYDTSGSYSVMSVSEAGCDSITTLQLSIFPSLSNTIMESACDIFHWNGQSYNQNGQYVYNGKSMHGCDSTVTLILTINTSKETIITHDQCGSFDWNGETYNQSGTYYNHTQTNQGCDSTVVLQLIVRPIEMVEEHITDCDSIVWNNLTIYDSGTYRDNFVSISGCDSTIIHHLDIRHSSSYSREEIACGEYDLFGNIITQSGIYQHILVNKQGCDSTLTTELKILSDFFSEETINHTGPYTWDVNKETYYKSGVYREDFITTSGCDSIYILHLRVEDDTQIHFPNILSTSGSNNFFTAISNNPIFINKLEIYDRWGNLVFEGYNFEPNEPAKGWNGYFSGRPVIPGVYIWIAEITLPNDDKKQLSGDLSVVR
ncbi:MAG: gliding motility-associated C-terminal domain-containing protein [Chitinophagales bacterium]|nr:gliding motility-associated C-terminal domain-containing protein [Chitinophagales bacterium]